MAGPITWRNVGGGGGNVSGLLQSGQQQVQQGFRALQDLFATNAVEDARNREAVKNFNTQQYLDNVAAADLSTLSTPEGQAALAQQRAGYGTAIDQAGTRNAIEQRLAAGQKAAIAQGQFDDFNSERDQRTQVDELRGLAAAGKSADVERILGENQFLNEGDLRKELAGVQDNLRQRELRETAEGRAVRGEARSAASHALSMEAGRENLNYSKKTHAESLRRIDETNAADSIALNAYQESKNATEAQNTLIQQIAEARGLSLKADGSIDLRLADEETKARVVNDLREAGAGGNSATAARQRLLDDARQRGLGTEATKLALDRFDAVAAFDQLAPEDQAKVQQEAQAATRPITDTQDRLTEEYNRKAKNNPFTAPPQDVTAEANKLVEGASKKFDGEWLATDINQRRMYQATTNMMQNGLSIKLNGEDVNVVVPPSVVERAINEVGAQVFAAEGPEVTKVIERIFKEDKGLQKQATEALDLRETYQKDMAKLSGEKLRAEQSVVRARKREKGVTVSSNDWVDAALRRN